MFAGTSQRLKGDAAGKHCTPKSQTRRNHLQREKPTRADKQRGQAREYASAGLSAHTRSTERCDVVYVSRTSQSRGQPGARTRENTKQPASRAAPLPLAQRAPALQAERKCIVFETSPHHAYTHNSHTRSSNTTRESRETLSVRERPTGRACVRHMAHGRPLSRAQRGCSARGRERCEVKHARRRRELCSSRAGGGVYGSRRRVPRPAGLYCCKMPKK